MNSSFDFSRSYRALAPQGAERLDRRELSALTVAAGSRAPLLAWSALSSWMGSLACVSLRSPIGMSVVKLAQHSASAGPHTCY